VDVQPPAGYEWEVNLFGSSVWVGIPPNAYPNITVSMFDGTLTSNLQTAANLLMNHHAMKIVINNTNYLRVNDASGAGQNFGYSATLLQRYA
jgi:hypothetical protein